MGLNLNTRIENDITITITVGEESLILKADYLPVARMKNAAVSEEIEDVYLKVVVMTVKEWNIENAECSLENKKAFFSANQALTYAIAEQIFLKANHFSIA